MPEAARHWAWLLLILLAGNILYVGLATIAQTQLDLTLGYSSVMHMGYIFLGIASYNIIGLSGAALLMFAHGLSIAALFAMCGELRNLQVHHIKFRSQRGSDLEENLITLCVGCHENIHRKHKDSDR